MDCRKEDYEDPRLNDIETKILKGLEPLNEDEVYYYIKNAENVEEVYRELNRWTITTDIYFDIRGHYYKLSYDKAATENQENEYWSQFAIEVEKVKGLVWKEVEYD